MPQGPGWSVGCSRPRAARGPRTKDQGPRTKATLPGSRPRGRSLRLRVGAAIRKAATGRRLDGEMVERVVIALVAQRAGARVQARRHQVSRLAGCDRGLRGLHRRRRLRRDGLPARRRAGLDLIPRRLGHMQKATTACLKTPPVLLRIRRDENDEPQGAPGCQGRPAPGVAGRLAVVDRVDDHHVTQREVLLCRDPDHLVRGNAGRPALLDARPQERFLEVVDREVDGAGSSSHGRRHRRLAGAGQSGDDGEHEGTIAPATQPEIALRPTCRRPGSRPSCGTCRYAEKRGCRQSQPPARRCRDPASAR